jgi:Tfp pilus assembly protein PilX
MKVIMGLLFVGIVVLSGCESAEVKQHHLYNLQQCTVETNAAEASLLKSERALEMTPRIHTQAEHNHDVADCMHIAEHTTIDFQLTKHDDYGKVVTQ